MSRERSGFDSEGVHSGGGTPRPQEAREVARKGSHGFFGGISRFGDYVLTFGTEFAVLGMGLIILKVAAAYWSASSFGEYMLARRVISLLQLPLLLSMGLAVTRYVAIAREAGDRGEAVRVFASALALVTAGCLALVVTLRIAGSPIAYALFGSRERLDLLQGVGLAVTGVVLHGVAYGEFRGRIQMLRANTLQGLNLGVLPLAVFLIPDLSVADFITLVGAGWTTVSLAMVIRILWVADRPNGPPTLSWSECKRLLKYGIPRVPGDFALGALFALPVTLAAHFSGTTMAGFVGLGLALLNMSGSLFAPVGHLILPAASAIYSSGDLASLRRDCRKLFAVGLIGSTAIVVAVQLFAQPLILWYVGDAYLDSVPIVGLISFAIPPYVTYVLLRYVLDAVRISALNSKNLIVSLCVFVPGAVMAQTINGLLWSFIASIVILGSLTAYDSYRVLRDQT